MKNSKDAVVLGLLSIETEEESVNVSFSATTGLQANVSVSNVCIVVCKRP